MKKNKLLKIIFAFGFLFSSNSLQSENIIHPQVILRNLQGKPLTSANQEMSPQASCSNCHDSNWILGHSVHNSEKVQVNCTQCHFEGGSIPADLRMAYTKITRPKNENCAPCHGIVYEDKALFSLPQNYEQQIRENFPSWFSQTRGTLFSPQFLSRSGLNLHNKKDLNFPFDVHAAAKVNCVHCHFTKNSPAQQKNKTSELSYLNTDPRREIKLQDYLQRPDHRLQTASCTDCHNPLDGHKNLPRKKRHLESSECQSCHIPAAYIPTFTAVDFTVSKQDGSPLVQYRNAEEKEQGKPFSLLLQKFYQPFLSLKANKENADAREKLAPFNFVSWFYWQDADKREIPFDVVQKAMLAGTSYKPQVMATFDADNDHNLSAYELRLDNEKKVSLIKELLQREGYANAQVQGRVENYPLQHGVVSSSFMQMDCSSCHGQNNRVQTDVFLSAYAPADVMPMLHTDVVQTQTLQKSSHGLVLKRERNLKGMYILGSSRVAWLSELGFIFFLFSLTGVAAHGGLRAYFSRRYPSKHARAKKEYMYTFYERLWHWTMAGSILLLLFTGAEIHFTGSFNFFGLLNATTIHNVLGFIVSVNAFLSLFYHLTTGEISQYFSLRRNFGKETISQIFFYVYGIFKGERHPVEKHSYRKTNPLQQITYVILLNLLLPFQVISGILIWGIERSAMLDSMLGGLTYIAPLHSFASWIFLSFIVMHVYLTTTGYSLSSNLLAMITGYDMVEEKDIEFSKQQKQLMQKGSTEMVRFYWAQFKTSFNKHFLKKENVGNESSRMKNETAKEKTKIETTNVKANKSTKKSGEGKKNNPSRNKSNASSESKKRRGDKK